MEGSAENEIRGKWFVFAFFGLLLVVMLSDLVSIAAGITPPGRRYNPAPLSLTPTDLKLGTVGTKLENFFEGRSLLYHGTGALYNEWIYQATGRLPGLVEGKDHWLFLCSNVTEINSPDRDSLVGNNLRFIGEVERRMQARGIQLFVVLTPDRSRVYPQRVYGADPAPPQRASFLPLIAERLTSAGIQVVNLTSIFQSEVSEGRDTFFQEDHHWNHHGSEVAANEVASRVKERCDLRVVEPARTFATTEAMESGSPRRSLVTLLKFRKESPVESRFLTDQRVIEFNPSWESLGPGADTGAGIVFESSFGKYGFPQYLERKLGAKLDSIVEPGNGSVFAVSRFLTEKAPAKEPYRFAVWEIPEYHLIEGLENQGWGVPIVLPDPFSSEDDDILSRAARFEMSGMTTRGRRLETLVSNPSLKLFFPEAVDRVRVRCMIKGNEKRGQIRCVGSPDSGLLLLTKTETPVNYDLRLDQAAKVIKLDLVLPESGYRILNLEIEGALSQP